MNLDRKMLNFVFVVLLFCNNGAQMAYADSTEPTCYSRFDYDMRMFETLADTKQKQKTLDDTVNKLEDIIEKLEAKVATQDTVNEHELRGLVEKLEAKVDVQEQHMQDQALLISKCHECSNDTGSGSSYVRWGRNSCPNNNGTSLIYKGVVGGSFYSHTGSGADYQCLPEDPTWGKYQDGTQGHKAYMYGAEYEHFDSLHDKEVPCAVCLTTRGPIIMIPARTSCYPGWTFEYEGNLASALYTHQKTHYTCIDKEAESTPEIDRSSNNGTLFYAVESRCGSLPCPPYVEGRELACVVCSK